MLSKSKVTGDSAILARFNLATVEYQRFYERLRDSVNQFACRFIERVKITRFASHLCKWKTVHRQARHASALNSFFSRQFYTTLLNGPILK